MSNEATTAYECLRKARRASAEAAVAWVAAREATLAEVDAWKAAAEAAWTASRVAITAATVPEGEQDHD